MSAVPAEVLPIAPSEALRFQAANAHGVKAVGQGNPGAAIAYYEEALEIRDDPAVWSNYGDSLARCGRLSEAKVAFEKSIELNPEYDQAWYNLAVTYEKLLNYGDARRCYQESLRRRVTPQALNGLGNIEHWLLNLEEADRCYRAAVKHGHGDSIWNLSLTLLMKGEFREGWDWYAMRPQMQQMRTSPLMWRGENLRGKAMIVMTEQGLGDSIFAMRYFPELQRQGARLTIACDPGLKRLVQAQMAETPEGLCPPHVIDKGAQLQGTSFDYETLAMSIPGYLSPDGVGPTAPYLRAQGVKLPAGLNVGLCWNGSTAIGAPAERNIPLAMLKPLSEIPDVNFYSLQKGDGVEEIANCGFSVADSMAGVTDVYDTACLIDSLDLVITIDTLIPHLAGALGKPTWLLNRYASCWQWGTVKHDPHLYATVQQFRQMERGNWAPVVEQVTHALRRLVSRDAERAAANFAGSVE